MLNPINETTINVTGRCILANPITSMNLNFVIELKNNKNEFFTFINETVDYCDKLHKEHDGALGHVRQLIKDLAPDVLQTCPIKNHWGVEKLPIDSSFLNSYPIWAAPFKTGRACLKAYNKDMELLGELKVYGEIVIDA